MAKKLYKNKKKKKKVNKDLNLTKIQKRIESLVKRNNSSLNYSYSSERIINSNKELIQKIKF